VASSQSASVAPPVNPLDPSSDPARRADQRAVRKSNLGLVARRISERRALSRAQLAKLTGLNKTTVSSLVAELIERGVVAESGVADAGRVGRPAQILELDDTRIAALGLEINVDYLAVCVCDLRGALRYRAAIGHDNRGSSPEVVFEALAELAAEALAECNVARIRILVFMISGGMSALGGIVLAARLSSVDLGPGGGTLLIDGIAAAVIGGTSLFGGRGEVRNALFGALVIATIANGLNTLGYSSGVIFIVTGVILLIAVTLDTVARRLQVKAGR
jgi:hypothetical protein